VKLRFKRNQILSSLPPEIVPTHLSHLQVLFLYGCTMLRSIPPEIGQLSNLRELDLRHCKLSRLSPQLGALTNKLEILDLSFSTDLICIPREVLNVFRNLRKLSMARCPWLNAAYLIIQGIQQSDSLEYLNINFNNIKPKDYEELLTILPSHFPRLMVLQANTDYRSTVSKEYNETSIASRIAQLEDQNTVRYLFSADKKKKGDQKPTTIPLSLWPLVFEKMKKRHSDRLHRAMNVI
jgi:Leucine-rich repeat (LRR) protein